eukprot:GFYU01004448.1.p1 GENE.GFYU01004448.1~~GFYU01004448.1.p1  ORF type:complete len:154 (-),score=40.75 GFYU01004448.1:187-648(-)
MLVNVTDVVVQNNPAKFADDFAFEITFQCLHELDDDLEWKLVYVGSAESEKYDQELDSVLVGPVPLGMNKFVFTTDGPNPTKIPQHEILGVTAVLLTCSYKEREFIRIGYYVNNEYDDPAMIQDPPEKVQLDRITRNILLDKPRVTRFAINWD